MSKESIEEILKEIGSEDVPAEVRLIAEETSEQFSKTLMPSRQHILWSNIIKSRITKLATAAAIIIAILVGIHQFGGSIDRAGAAFAQTIQASKKMPWMHVVIQTNVDSQPSHENGEYWYCFDSGIEAIRYETGKFRFFDYGKQVGYVYNPTTEELTISRLPERELVLGVASPWAFVEHVVEELSKNEGARVTWQVGQYDGTDVEIYEVRVPKKGRGIREWKFIADSKSHLLKITKIKGYDADGNIKVCGEMTFDYPAKGPQDIYEIGAPKAAAVVDYRTETDKEVEDIIKTYYMYRENSPSRYIAIVTQSSHNKHTGSDVTTGVNIIYADGRLQRIEMYHVYDMSEYLRNWSKYSAEMGSTLDSLLKWWTQTGRSECTYLSLYDGEYNYFVSYDIRKKSWLPKSRLHSPERNRDERGLADLGWPQSGLYLWGPDLAPIRVVEDDYSRENNLICLQSLRRQKRHKDSPRGLRKQLWYLKSRRDYICQRLEEHCIADRYVLPLRQVESQLKAIEPADVNTHSTRRISIEVTLIREVTEFAQTDARQWYPKKIKSTWYNDTLKAKQRQYFQTIYLKTNPKFPEGIFDPENLPKGAE